LQDKLEKWNKEKESQQVTEQDKAQEAELFAALYQQNRNEEEEFRQKSICLWIQAGDKNTTFFHNNLKIRRVGNQINKIHVAG